MIALLCSAAVAIPQELEASGPRDLEAVLAAHPEKFAAVLDAHAQLRLQLSVAELVERPDGSLALERSTLGDLDEYFYPASSIKTAAAVAALEFVEELNAEHGTAFGLESELEFAPLFEGEVRAVADPSNLAGGRITLGHEIRKLSIVSDNEAFNRLYELVGQDRLDASMARAGFPSFRLVHRLSEWRSPEENLRSPSILLREGRGGEQLVLPARVSAPAEPGREVSGLYAGDRYVGGSGQLVEEPFSFHGKNRVDLVELQDFLVELVRPEVDTGRRGFPGLTAEQRAFLLEAMRELPRESANPVYDPDHYGDDYVKFLLPGLERVLDPARIRIWNKVGLAYGFTVENACVQDVETGRCFFVAAALYTNPNRTLNDGVYGYDDVALPFYADLGEVLGRLLLSVED